MKTHLTKEQSQRLMELGVPREKASRKHIELTLEEYRTFDLCDLLEILPKFVGQSGLDIHVIATGEWQAMFYAYHPSSKIAPELIDALYELACWYYWEFLKREKK